MHLPRVTATWDWCGLRGGVDTCSGRWDWPGFWQAGALTGLGAVLTHLCKPGSLLSTVLTVRTGQQPLPAARIPLYTQSDRCYSIQRCPGGVGRTAFPALGRRGLGSAPLQWAPALHLGGHVCT